MVVTNDVKRVSSIKNFNLNKEVSPELLQCFWDLAEIDEDRRVKATQILLHHLKDDSSMDVEMPTRGDGEVGIVENDLDAVLERRPLCFKYAIKRLCKGLCSERLAARQGFSLGLVSVLSELGDDSDDIVLALLKTLESFSTAGEKDEILGHAFGLAAISRSNIHFIPTSAVRVIDSAVNLAEKKSFLRQAMAFVILEFLKHQRKHIEHILESSKKIQKWISMSCKDYFPEALVVVLFVWPYMKPNMRKSCKLLQFNVGDADFEKMSIKDRHMSLLESFTQDHMKLLTPSLRSTTECHPRVHIVWKSLLSFLFPELNFDGYEKVAEMSHAAVLRLDSFWRVFVENDMFRSPSHKRKYLGFKIFIILAARIAPSGITVLLTSNFLSCLSNNSSQENQNLYSIATEVLDSLSASINRAAPGLRSSIYNQIRTLGGRKLLNRIKIRVNERLPSLSENQSDTCVDTVISVLDKIELSSSDHSTTEQFQILSDQLVSKVKSDPDCHQTTKHILECFVRITFGGSFQRTKDSIHDDGPSMYFLVANQLLAALAATKTKDNGQDWFYWTVDLARSIATLNDEDKDLESSLVSFDEAREAVEKALALIKGKESKTFEKAKKLQSLSQLISILELHAMMKSNDSDALLADDVRHLTLQYTGTMDGFSEGGQEWSNVLMGVILSTLARNEAPLASSVLRNLAENAFKHFIPDFSSTAIQDLLQIVMQPLNQAQQMEGASSSEDDDDLSSEEENQGQEEDVEEEDDQESDQDEDKDQEFEQENEDEQPLDKESEEDDDLNDEQMFELDGHFSSIVSAMQNRRDTKQLKLDLLNFKMRVLSCIKIFMKVSPANGALLQMPVGLLAGLLDATGANGDANLAKSLSYILETSLARCKAEQAGESATAEVQDQLRRSLYLASRGENKIVRNAADAAYLFLLRAVFACKTEEILMHGKESLLAAVNDFFTKKKSKLNRNFFSDIFHRIPRAALCAVPEIMHRTNSSRNEYLRLEGYGLIDIGLKSAGKELTTFFMDKKLRTKLADSIVSAITKDWSKSQREQTAIKHIHNILTTSKSCGLNSTRILDDSSFPLLKVSIEGKRGTGKPHLEELLALLLNEISSAEDNGDKDSRRNKRHNGATIAKDRRHSKKSKG